MSVIYSSVPRLLVDGVQVDAAVQTRVARVEVDQRERLPAMLSVLLRDGARSVLDDSGITIGTRLEVLAGSVGESATTPLVLAEVLTVEVSYTAQDSAVTIRGYDLSHRLHRYRHTRSWTEVTDGELVRRVAEEAGLKLGPVDDPGVIHDHVAQIDQSDFDFLAGRARDAGRVLRVVGDQVHLVTPPEADTAPEPGGLSSDQAGQLVLGVSVDSLQAGVTAAGLPSRVEVRGWDTGTKQAVVADAEVHATRVQIGLDPAALARDRPPLVVADRAVTTREEAQSLAAALADEAAATFAYAQATCSGNPQLQVGRPVSLGLAGSTFSGRWTISGARHTFDADGYRTRVDLGSAPSPTRPRRTPTADPVVGVVTDVADPDAQGRVRVRLPWLSEGYVSDWARVLHPGAGAERGLLLLPEVEDEVLVGFEQGDPRRPVVLGGLHNGVDVPPLGGGQVDGGTGEVRHRGLVSRRGHQVLLDDGTDSPGIRLETGDGSVRMVLDDSARHLTITSTGDVSVHGEGAVEVTGRTISVTGQQEVALSAPTVVVEADSDLTLRGGVVKVN